MTELYIIHLHLGSTHTFTTAVAHASEVNDTIRPHAYSRAEVHHWVREPSNPNAPNWRKHREIRAWY